MIIIFNGIEEDIIDTLITRTEQFFKLNFTTPTEIIEYSLQDIKDGRTIYQEIFDYVTKHHLEKNVIYKHGYIDEAVQHEIFRGTPSIEILKTESKLFSADNDLKNDIHVFTVIKNISEASKLFTDQVAASNDKQRTLLEVNAKLKKYSSLFLAYDNIMNKSESNKTLAGDLNTSLILLEGVLAAAII
jgi:hypothetical protein